MKERQRFRLQNIYISLTVLVGAFVLFYAIYVQFFITREFEFLWIAVCIALFNSKTVRIPGLKSQISISDTFIFLCIIKYNPAAAAITAFIDSALTSLKITKKFHKISYNSATMVITVILSGGCFERFLELFSQSNAANPASEAFSMIPALMIMALVQYLVNSGMIAVVIAMGSDQKIYRVWRDNFLWTSITYFSGASAAWLIFHIWESIGFFAMIISFPIMAITYFTYKTYLDKVEATNKHAVEMADLYLSITEALAMAIDAKDQITHGHVRRVQTYALELADAIGIKNEKELHALQSAALLHDIGKLAVPDYILNKPGSLSSTEFEKVKIHPRVGAEILSSVPFPYDVASIVKCHHENYDGSGYPDNLNGDSIPECARILTIADCYDALRSDRPYRKGFSVDEAIEIMKEDSGVKYDPFYLHKFIEIIHRIEKKVAELNIENMTLKSELAGSGRQFSPEEKKEESSISSENSKNVFSDISRAQKEILSLYEISQTLSATLDLKEILEIITKKMKSIVHFDMAVIFMKKFDAEKMTVMQIEGEEIDSVQNKEIPIPSGSSGWVFANRDDIINGSASNDLRFLMPDKTSEYDSCLSTIISQGDQHYGVFTLYSKTKDFFSLDHLRILKMVSHQTAVAISNAILYQKTREDSLTDPLTGMPNARFLYIFGAQKIEEASKKNLKLAILSMDLDNFKQINDQYGHHIGDRLLKEVSARLASHIRKTDIFVRYAGDEFLAIIELTHKNLEYEIIERLQKTVDEWRMEVRPGKFARVGLSVGLSVLPKDGNTLEDLMVAADDRMYKDKSKRKSTEQLSSEKLIILDKIRNSQPPHSDSDKKAISS